jgi:hypothetical protein
MFCCSRLDFRRVCHGNQGQLATYHAAVHADQQRGSLGFVPFEHTSLDTTVTPDAQGRFQVDMPLGDPITMSSYDNLYLDIRETGGSLIATIPVQYAPRAWYSQHSISSTLAETATFAQDAGLAQQAITAISATQADELTNDQTVTLTLESWCSPGAATPKATRVGNMVHLTGMVVVSSPVDAGIPFAWLPPEMTPSQVFTLTADTKGIINGSEVTPIHLSVRTDGQIRNFSAINQTNDQNYFFILNGCSFLLE